MSTFRKDGSIDPSQGVIVTCFGKKRSGKSVMGRLLFHGYPYDRLVISANEDDGPFADPARDITEIRGTLDELPAKWPEELRRHDEAGPRRMTLRYVPDPGSATVLEDCDHMLGVAQAHGHCAVLVHEVRFVAPAGRVPPHMNRLLNNNRHDHITMILCGPRPITVDPLVIGQSDLIYIFEMQVAADRRRVAETIGWDPRELDDAIDDLGPHEYLRYDANQAKPANELDPDMRLVHCPALPADVVRQASR